MNNLQKIYSIVNSVLHRLFNVKYLYRGRFYLNISNNDLVLHIGSGGFPDRRANIGLEKYVGDNLEGSSTLVRLNNLVVADVMNLPFKDKSIDYILCPHVLEHVQDPDMAISEIVRCSKKGFIETPTPISETFFPAVYHEWYVYSKNKTLVFSKITSTRRKNIRQLFSKEQTLPIHHLSDSRNTIYEYDNNIKHEIHHSDSSSEAVHSELDTDYLLATNSLSEESLLRKIIRWITNNKKIYLEDYLSCPACNNDLEKVRNNLICKNNSDHSYPIVNNIPILLIEKS